MVSSGLLPMTTTITPLEGPRVCRQPFPRAGNATRLCTCFRAGEVLGLLAGVGRGEILVEVYCRPQQQQQQQLTSGPIALMDLFHDHAPHVPAVAFTPMQLPGLARVIGIRRDRKLQILHIEPCSVDYIRTVAAVYS